MQNTLGAVGPFGAVGDRARCGTPLQPVIATRPVSVRGTVLHEIYGAAREHLLTILRRVTHLADQSTEFPGPFPISIERAHFPKLSKLSSSTGGAEYVACEKTDGWRALLLCTDYRGINICCLIDRSLTLFLFPIHHVPTALWQGSLFDGEVAQRVDTKRWSYLVFDAHWVAGIPIIQRPFLDRMAVVQRAWGAYTFDPAVERFEIRLKQFIPREDIEVLPAYLAKVAQHYRTDGVILTPNVPGITYGRKGQHKLFKLKTLHHSVDFLVMPSETSTHQALGVFDPVARSHVRVALLSRECPVMDAGSVVECVQAKGQAARVDGLEVWVMLGLRTDKAKANDRTTFEKTVLNAHENIVVSELVDALK